MWANHNKIDHNFFLNENYLMKNNLLKYLNFGGKSLNRVDFGKENNCFDFEVFNGELQMVKQFETVTLMNFIKRVLL